MYLVLGFGVLALFFSGLAYSAQVVIWGELGIGIIDVMHPTKYYTFLYIDGTLERMAKKDQPISDRARKSSRDYNKFVLACVVCFALMCISLAIGSG